MKKNFYYVLSLLSLLLLKSAYAASTCDLTMLTKHKEQVLACYLAVPENLKQDLVLESTQYDAEAKVTVETYTLASQVWPKPELSHKGLIWKHTLVLYRPDQLQSEQALLFITGGTRLDNHSWHIFKPNNYYQVDFKHLATETSTLIVELRDIPNGYLTLDDGQSRKEDGLVAYSWNRYLDDPVHNNYWLVHLAMTKAAIKAMDAVQGIMAQQHYKISKFMVSGASKRGWTTWLTALSDPRVNAIVPIVIDILNMKKNIELINLSYDNGWPPAFHDYVEQKIPERMQTPEFATLAKIMDPLAYLDCDDCETYKQRLSIPKYIISAGGDDFFVPDSLNLYVDKLPGQTRVRMVLNQPHYIDMKIVEGALLSYYRLILKHEKPETLQWKTNTAGFLQAVTTQSKPLSVKLWEAENPDSRDFRVAAGIKYHSVELKGECKAKECTYPVQLKSPSKGWKASFVEVTFEQKTGEPLILTTPAYVLGA